MIIKQISIFLENKPGRISDVTRLLAEKRIDIQALNLVSSGDFGMLRLLVNDVEKVVRLLSDEHFAVVKTDVIRIVVPNKSGSLDKVLNVLAQEQTSIDYMYAFQYNNKAYAVIRPQDMNACLNAMSKLPDEDKI